MAAFPVSAHLFVAWGETKYRVFRADGKVQLWIDDAHDSMWITIGGDRASLIRDQSGWTPEEDTWRPSWWFGKQKETSNG